MKTRIDARFSSDMHPDDVAWVAEWQLHSALGAGASDLPGGEASRVRVEQPPRTPGECWRILARVGAGWIPVDLPDRETQRIVSWCWNVSEAGLCRPSPAVRASLGAVARAVRRALRQVDPLAGMGYPASGAGERNRAG